MINDHFVKFNIFIKFCNKADLNLRFCDQLLATMTNFGVLLEVIGSSFNDVISAKI